ncbi:MAG TPA: MarR family transcriptional regulator [Nocardioidaceae bacterium]|nr:MarR family transcriptional regulator [Nocardioidaceae bacterium]
MGVKTWLRDTHRHLYVTHTPASLFLLALLDRHGPTRVSDLAEHARVDTSVVSRQVAQVVQLGFVERTPDADDGRAHRVALTAAGAQVLRDGRDALAGMVTERLGDWSPQEIQTFSARLRRLLASLTD